VVRRKACAFPGADPTTWFTIVSLSHAWLAACGGRIKRAHEAGRIRNSLSRVKAGFEPFFAAFFWGVRASCARFERLAIPDPYSIRVSSVA